ncbi:uracil-DNA glycosylase family protein [Nafulsella turpanensis]|uniref:uracil-DNA glycosylase family protein n=1 Tax=Nafulsella turpanensis TaxID=1265690 RepID=UPI00034ADD9E|nr:uracil-DNA glycosylase family protein [Nafulsella turpanensis]
MPSSVETLQKELAACRLCQHSFSHEPRPMIWGHASAPVMLIGQAPSRRVHETGKPFNDMSGRRLRNWLALNEEQFWNKDFLYISAMGHCFPGKALKGGGDNKPPKVCSETWMPRLLESFQPQLYLLVGSYAAQYFFPKKKLSELVFEELSIRHKPAFVLPHPSPLNQKWFKDYPEFEQARIYDIRAVLQQWQPLQ